MDEARVKKLMATAGYPESQTIQQLIYQVANEVEQDLVNDIKDIAVKGFDGQPPWWPDCPYPADIFPMTTKDYVRAVANPELRTAVSGHMARFGWEVAEKQFRTLFEEYRINLQDPVDIKEVIQALTDSNTLLDDLQRIHEILPDSQSGNRKMTCDDARMAYDMGDRPYAKI